MQFMDGQPLVTVEEAAQQLRVSPDSIRRFLRDKKLRGVRVGGQWRIPADALHEVHSPIEEILDEQIITLTDHEVEGVKIPAGTLGYVAVHSRGSGACYADNITVRETPCWALPRGPANRLPDFVLHLSEQDRSWKFVTNEGNSRALQVPRAVLQELRTLINTAYSTTTEKDRDNPLKRAYMIVRAALGSNDRSDEDAILKAVEAEAKAPWPGL